MKRDVVSLSEVKRAPNEKVIKTLSTVLEQAMSGELQGVVVLCNLGDACASWSAGDTSFTDLLAAFEDWKFQQLDHRNLEQVQQ